MVSISNARYRAVDEHNMPFVVAYGSNWNDEYVAGSIKQLAKHIAYYNKRCYAKLQVLGKDNIWVDANVGVSSAFAKILSLEFFFNETK